MKKAIFPCLLLILLMCNIAFAERTRNVKLEMAENNPVASIGCKVYKILIHGITTTILWILFIFTALGFYIGKVSWGIGIALLCGCGLTLTSGTLVRKFVGGAGGGGNGTEDVCKCKYELDEDCESAYFS